jgi:hypothetical protein
MAPKFYIAAPDGLGLNRTSSAQQQDNHAQKFSHDVPQLMEDTVTGCSWTMSAMRGNDDGSDDGCHAQKRRNLLGRFGHGTQAVQGIGRVASAVFQ